MTQPLATTADVEDLLLRPLTPEETPVFTRLIVKASAALRQRMPSVDARLAASAGTSSWLDPVLVADVVATAVKRFTLNPEGIASGSTTVGPYAETKTYAIRGDALSKVGDTRGQLVITDADLARLEVHQPTGRPGVIRTSPALAPWPYGRLGFADAAFGPDSPTTGTSPTVVEVPVPIYGPDR